MALSVPPSNAATLRIGAPQLSVPPSNAGTLRVSSPQYSSSSFRPGSSASSPANVALATTGRSLLKAQSTGSLSNSQGLKKSAQQAPDAGLWSTKWRPAPAHLVEDWHALGSLAKGAVMRVRDNLQKGDVQTNLSNCNLGNPGSSLVAEVILGAKLRTVNLQNNQICDAGASQLAEALGTMEGLQMVCLSSNCVGDAGASSLAKFIEQHSSLKLVSLDRNRISDPGASRLLTALGKNPRKEIEVVLAHNPVKRLGTKALESLAQVAACVERLSQQGVTLGTLLRIYTDGVADGSIRPRHTSTGEVVQRLLLPSCEVAMRSYVEVVTPGNPPPMTQVIHAWDALFEDLVRAVASHACGQRNVEVLDPSHHQWCYSPNWTGKSYFIDAFCVNQHAHVNVRAHREFSRFVDHPRRPTFSLGAPHSQVDKLDLVAHKIAQRGGRLLVVCDNDNLLLTRIHCLHELHQAIQDGLPLDVNFSGVRLFPRSRRGEMVQLAEASLSHYRDAILETVRDSPGGYERFNQVVLNFIDKHVEREFNAVLEQFESKPY
mmetsp:Transcript_52039/g.120958  ORF Transcript_52039/g.120958 Transcript_52039/m.120958 type:complete len:546 (-) Transcript_52039:177-1814(-)